MNIKNVSIWTWIWACAVFCGTFLSCVMLQIVSASFWGSMSQNIFVAVCQSRSHGPFVFSLRFSQPQTQNSFLLCLSIASLSFISTSRTTKSTVAQQLQFSINHGKIYLISTDHRGAVGFSCSHLLDYFEFASAFRPVGFVCWSLSVCNCNR